MNPWVAEEAALSDEEKINNVPGKHQRQLARSLRLACCNFFFLFILHTSVHLSKDDPCKRGSGTGIRQLKSNFLVIFPARPKTVHDGRLAQHKQPARKQCREGLARGTHRTQNTTPVCECVFLLAVSFFLLSTGASYSRNNAEGRK